MTKRYKYDIIICVSLSRLYRRIAMTKGKKIYFIITLVIAAITLCIHFFALGTFIDIRVNGETDLEKGLSAIFIGMFWMVGGGISTVISLFTGGFLFKVSKKWALITVCTVVGVTVLTFFTWLAIANGWV